MSRSMDTCDSQDLAIESLGTTRLVYAHSDEIPVNGTPHKHSSRGTQSIRLSSPGQTDFKPPETDVASFDIKFDTFNVPFNDRSTGPDTTYYCGAFALPAVSQKHHIIRFEPLILPGSNKGTVHHILIYDCVGVEASYLGIKGHCHNGNLPSALQRCNGGTPIATWAIGGVGTTYPDHVGYPLEPTSAGTPRVVLMEIHYNNPALKEVVDESGVRFFMTSQLRKYDAGILDVGHFTNGDFTIPAGKTSHLIDAWCPGLCTNKLPPTGIHIIGTLLHAHLAGSAINLRQIRGGKEIKVILEDRRYDFNFQDFEMLDEEVTILPGDSLLAQCYYNTADRTYATPFGLPTHQEMCLTYSIYYPKLPSTSTCLYGNYSELGSSSGVVVECFEGSHHNLGIPAFTPLAPSTCTRVPPPAGRTTPKLGTIASFDPSKYEYQTWMDDEQHYKLYWTIDKAAHVVHLAAEVNATGWVGLGFSPSGGMVGSDVSIAWIESIAGKLTANHADRFATAFKLPGVDTLQDYFDIIIRKN